jgi:phage FluMu protein Com
MGGFAAEGYSHIEANCPRCRVIRLRPISDQLPKIAMGLTLDALARRLRCAECGGPLLSSSRGDRRMRAVGRGDEGDNVGLGQRPFIPRKKPGAAGGAQPGLWALALANGGAREPAPIASDFVKRGSRNLVPTLQTWGSNKGVSFGRRPSTTPRLILGSCPDGCSYLVGFSACL